MNLRVAAVVEQLWHRVPGGTARATSEVLTRLAERGECEIHGIAGWHNKSQRDRELPGVQTHYVEAHRRVLYEAWLRFGFPSVEREAGPVDVTWASSMIVPPTKSPVVSTVHDLGFLDHPEHLSRRGRSFFPRAWRGVVAHSDRIVCPSSVVADDCMRHGVASDRLIVIPWGVSTPECLSAAEAESVRVKLGLPERFVLWVGTLEPRKNLSAVVSAMAQLDDDIDLVAVGPKGWELSVEEVFSPLKDRTHRIGWVDEFTLSALYRAATVFVFPSLLEGFGLPVLEAMAHGTPVITSGGTATEEAAGGAAMLVDPTDEPAISLAIKELLHDDGLRDSLRSAGLKQAERLSWSSTVDSYLEVFHEVA